MNNDAPPERIENPRSAARAGVRLRRIEGHKVKSLVRERQRAKVHDRVWLDAQGACAVFSPMRPICDCDRFRSTIPENGARV